MTKTETKNTVTLPPVQVTPDFKIANYDTLVKDAKDARDKYIGFIGTAKECRSVKRRFNAVRREWNNLRKTTTKPTRDTLKQFKAQIDNLRGIMNEVPQAMNKQLDIYKQQRLDKLINDKLKPSMKEICHSRGVEEQPIPKEALKLSMTKKKRLDFMAGVADEAKEQVRLAHAKDVQGKAVNTQTGEVIGEARHLTFKGSKDQLDALMKFADKHRIILQ